MFPSLTATRIGGTLAVLVLAAATLTDSPAAAQGATPDEPVAEGTASTFVVTLADGARSADGTSDAVEDTVRGLDLPLADTTQIGESVVALTFDAPLTDAEEDALTDRLTSSTAIDSVEPELWATIAATPGPSPDQLWSVMSGAAGSGTYGVDAPGAWESSRGEGIVVGVVDTGITAHPDLDANVVAGYDFVGDPDRARDGDHWDDDPTDEGDYCPATGAASTWHGTHVAGTIAGAATDSGALGVAPSARIMPLRVLGACGGSEIDVLSALRWAAGLPVAGTPQNPNPVDVLNLSLGFSVITCPASVQAVITEVVESGVVVVAAAGNHGVPLYAPANCEGVIAVTATTATGWPAGYSNYGTEAAPATIAAPGGALPCTGDDAWTRCVVSSSNTGTSSAVEPGYASMAGTSMATPHVSAVAALVLAQAPCLSPAEITGILTGSSRATAVPTSSTGMGSGIVNAAAAVAATAATESRALNQPGISGHAALDSILTATVDDTAPAGAQYEWLRGCEPIEGANDSVYQVTEDDLGQRIRVRVAGTIDAEPVSRTSRATAPVATAITAVGVPTISDTSPSVAQTLTADISAIEWSPAAVTLTYQWNRNGIAIADATAPQYTVGADVLDRRLSVSVTATRAGVAPLTVTSASTGRVGLGSFEVSSRATVSGTPAVGQRLTADPGAWTPTPTAWTHQWYREGLAIAGATGPEYTVAAADRGTRLTVAITGHRDGISDATSVSSPTATIVAGTFTVTQRASITGTAKVGTKLRAQPGTWSPHRTEGSATTTYQWYRGSTKIAGATSSAYTPTAADRGKRITVRITLKRAGFTTAHSSSAATKAVVAGTFAGVTKPTVRGAARVGKKLTATAGASTPSATRVTYQWYRGSAKISGATARSYAVKARDRGHRITVKVTLTRSGFTARTTTSQPTAVVKQ